MSVASPASIVDQWLPAELEAWKPVERLCPSEWAEKNRHLTRMQTARPGPWRNDQAPYLAGLMDLCANRRIVELTIVKAAQMGMSEALRNVLGYYAHQEPDPVLLVLPDEQIARKIMAQRILPLIQTTPCLTELVPDARRKVQLRHMGLSNGFTLRLGWSGSPATLASDPCRIVINDEVDKFQPWSGRESDPISLGYARTQTYEGRRLILNCSTPTTTQGMIWKRYEAANTHIEYVVPCPHCGAFQTFAFAQIKWPAYKTGNPHKDAARLEAERAAWYECIECRQRIEERDHARMVRGGRWQTDEGDGLGDVAGRVGVHMWAAMCLWIPWYRIAAEFLRCKDDPIALMGFVNSWLGEPSRQQIMHAPLTVFEAKSRAEDAPPAGVVPRWAKVLLATADTQKDHFYYVVRAWGDDFRSQRVDHGVVTTFAELRERALGHFPPETEGQPPVPVQLLGIDSGGTRTDSGGSRTHEVYRFAAQDTARVRALKGEGRSRDIPLKTSKITYTPPGQRTQSFAVFLTLMDANHYKDRLAHAIQATMPGDDDETPMWGLNDANDPDYNRQMTAEHKILARTARGRQEEVWELVSSGAANHYWDCEYMQFALADMARVDRLGVTPERKHWSQRRGRGRR